MNTTALKDDGNERNCLDNFSVRSCGGPMGSPLSPSLKGGACAASTAKVIDGVEVTGLCLCGKPLFDEDDECQDLCLSKGVH